MNKKTSILLSLFLIGAIIAHSGACESDDNPRIPIRARQGGSVKNDTLEKLSGLPKILSPGKLMGRAAEVSDPSAVLSSWCTSQDWSTRYVAAEVIGTSGNGDTPRTLLTALSRDQDWRVRLSAILAWRARFQNPVPDGYTIGIPDSRKSLLKNAADFNLSANSRQFESLRSILKSVENSDFRLYECAGPNGQNLIPRLFRIVTPGYAPLTATCCVTLPARYLYLRWTRGRKISSQKIAVPRNWLPDLNCDHGLVRVLVGTINSNPGIVLELATASGTFNYSSYALYVYRNGRWHIEIDRLPFVSCDDSGNIVITNAAVYISSGEMDGETRNDPQHYCVTRFKLTRGLLGRGKVFHTRKLYMPEENGSHSPINELAAFKRERIVTLQRVQEQ